jgi:uncharacterized membrane protein YidH (DUF202 family)
MKNLGVVLIILGVLALAYQGFSYTKREKVIDLGPIEASADKKKHVAIPPIVGGIVLVAGVVMVVASRKSS